MRRTVHRQPKIGLSIISLVIISMASPPVKASVLRFLELEELTETSDLIVLGKVMEVRSGRDDTRARIRTRVTLNVERVFRGSIERETLSFYLPGGFVPGERLQQVIPGVPQFAVGEESIVFLCDDPTLFCPIAGWLQGTFKLVTDEVRGGSVVLDTYAKCRRYRERKARIADLSAPRGAEKLSIDEFASILDEIQNKSLSKEVSPGQEDTAPPDHPEMVSASPVSEQVLANFNYSGYKWQDEDIPVGYYVYLGLAPPDGIATATYVDAVKGAFQKWEDVRSSYMAFSYRGQTTAYRPNLNRTDGRNTVGWTDERLGPGALAVTCYWFPGGDYITEFDIAIARTITGDAYWSADTPTPSTAYDLHSVLLHETGHTLSLDHVKDRSQVMYAYISDGEMKRELAQGDIDGITFIYPMPADLSISDVKGPSSALEYEQIELSAKICNVGGDGTGTFQVEFYLSLDSSIGPEDMLLRGTAVPGLDLGEEYDVSVFAEAPPVAAEGDYYVCATADADEVISEAVEDNNTDFYFPLKVRFDTDADGLPNWWEEEMSLNPYDASGADGSEGDPDGEGLFNNKEYQLGTNPHLRDTDGDGQNDSDEVAAGTDATDGASLFHMTRIAVTGTGDNRWVAVAWTTVSGKRYQVYYQDRPAMAWLPLGPIYNGNGEVMSHDDLVGLSFPSRIYRVGVENGS